MDDNKFREGINDRAKLINEALDILGEVRYDNNPIGYVINREKKIYSEQMHSTMRDGILSGLQDIEKLIVKIRESVKNSD